MENLKIDEVIGQLLQEEMRKSTSQLIVNSKALVTRGYVKRNGKYDRSKAKSRGRYSSRGKPNQEGDIQLEEESHKSCCAVGAKKRGCKKSEGTFDLSKEKHDSFVSIPSIEGNMSNVAR